MQCKMQQQQFIYSKAHTHTYMDSVQISEITCNCKCTCSLALSGRSFFLLLSSLDTCSFILKLFNGILFVFRPLWFHSNCLTQKCKYRKTVGEFACLCYCCCFCCCYSSRKFYFSLCEITHKKHITICEVISGCKRAGNCKLAGKY